MTLVSRMVAVSVLFSVYVPASQNSEEAFGSPSRIRDAQRRRLPLTSTYLDQRHSDEEVGVVRDGT